MSLSLIIRGVFEALEWLIIARIILSFLPMFTKIDPYHPVIRFVHETTEPLLAPFRRLLPAAGGLDFSPLLLFLVLNFIEGLLLDLVRGL